MAISIAVMPPERVTFAHIPDIRPMPSLIQIQLDSQAQSSSRERASGHESCDWLASFETLHRKAGAHRACKDNTWVMVGNEKIWRGLQTLGALYHRT